MFEIGGDELKVMNCLVHAEQVMVVVQETGISEKVVRDIIRNLHHYRFIRAVNEAGKAMPMYDADKILKIRFILTAKGIETLQNPK